MLILNLRDETSTSWGHYICLYPLNRSSKAISSSSKSPMVGPMLNATKSSSKKFCTEKSWMRKRFTWLQHEVRPHSRCNQALHSTPWQNSSDHLFNLHPKMWAAQSQTISPQLESGRKWLARRVSKPRGRRRKTSTPPFAVLLKAVVIQWDTIQNKLPGLNPLLLTLVPDSPHSSWHQMSCARSMLRNLVVYQIWSMVSITRK